LKKKSQSPLAVEPLHKHFGRKLAELTTASRTYPVTSRADLQRTLDHLFQHTFPARLSGVHPQYAHEPITVAHLTTVGHMPVFIGPLVHDEVDIGEEEPARCLRFGLWLGRERGVPFCFLVSPAQHFGRELGVRVEFASPAGTAGAELSRKIFKEIDQRMTLGGSYRGKVLSLEQIDSYSGQGGGVKVHRLRSVTESELVLPNKTLALLNRNVLGFVAQRDQLARYKMPLKKGLLFYGPPGTGKTYTIHYLAGKLTDHTTLLITAEQVGLLDSYIQLARFLQPAIVVIEDVDLIARDRESMGGPCEESLLNKLLNEMDGLREDASIIFILTSNRPEKLERALAARPGRVDQAIEFPLPDEDGRMKLIELYSRGLTLDPRLIANTVARTANASAAFIKELMRRTAQFLIEDTQEGAVSERHINAALEEMLFSGGSVNLKLLGVGSIENETPEDAIKH
jgi:hypothetical protein